MKTIKQLQSQIETNNTWLSRSENFGIPKRKSVIRENSNLKELVKYLETKPNESFLVSEKQRLSKIIKSKESNYSYWLEHVCPDSVPLKKRKSLFNKENNLAELKRFLKNINFLLV